MYPTTTLFLDFDPYGRRDAASRPLRRRCGERVCQRYGSRRDLPAGHRVPGGR